MNYQSLISSIWCNCTQPFNLLLLFLTLGFSPATVHAQQTPCDCAQRWEKGAHWNPDGTINDAPNAPAPLGIIRCGSSAETQAQLIPGTCTYNPNQFYIDVELAPCVEPSTGVSVSAKNPKAGQPIIWLNFDVRANAGSFQVQINDNSGDKIAWALYYSTTHQAGVNNNGLSGNCNTLVFAACGVESASTWNTLPVPSFSQPTNYYMAIWDQNADGNLAVNNFKARFGCGDADVLVCNLEVSPETTQCQEDTYTVEIPIQGINSNYVGYDPNATPPTSAPVCLTNSGTTDVTSGTIIMTYPQSVTNYNIEISIDDNPDDDCPDPANPGDCSTIVSGTAPDCCTGPVISCPEDVTVSCEQSLDPADIGSAEAAEGCGEVTISHTDELFPGGCATETIIKRTWTATDEDGNTDDCVQTITVQDNTAPIPPPAPQNITISCSGLVPEPVELMALDNCGGEIPGIPSSGIIVGECVNEYEIERVWIFTDACGNTSSVSQTITVKDTEAPATPEPPADATYQCAAEVPVAESLTTTDNCEGELTVMPTEETFPSECASDFVLIRTWTFADECGNSTSVSQTITVQDTEAPATPEPPADATYQCASDVPAADELSTTDNCDGELTVEPTEATFPGECANDYVLVRTWTFTDQCGNSSSVFQTITVKDTEAPATPEPPADATYQCASDVPTADELSTTDNCDGELTVEPTEATFPGECANDFVLVRTWTFTDQCGNSSSVSQTITVKDTEAPATPEPPADATYQCASNVPAADELSTTDNCDGELTVQPTEQTFPGECANDFVLVRTWTFTDQCGNSSSVFQTITVKDTEAPATPEPPADATYQCVSDVPAADELSTTDNCDDELTVDPTEETFPGECANDYILVRTWTFSDQCGNSSSVSQTITVKDTEAPVPQQQPTKIRVYCADDVPAPQPLSAIDNCDGMITVMPIDNVKPGACPNDFVITRTWTFTDQCGNRTKVSQKIRVKDTRAPKAPKAPADLTVQCASDVPLPVELTAVDNCEGNIVVFPTEDIVPGSCINDYILVRTWTFTDQCGNSSSVSQTITVKDTEAPATPEPPADATYQCASDVPAADVLSTTDNCDGDLTTRPTEATFPGECANDYVLVRTWTFTDQCGNSSSVSQTITVKDTEAPATPAPPADATYQCADEVPVAEELSTTDNCDGEIIVMPTETTMTGSCANDVVFIRTWTFTDQCGNSSSVSQTLTVKDTEAPATPEAPADITVQCAGDVPAIEKLTTTDNCSGELSALPTEQLIVGSCPNDYTIVRTWTFTDDCGNSTSVSQTITVKDTEAPVAPEPPADITIQCTDDIPDQVDLTATDNCDGDITVSPDEVATEPEICDNNYTITRTWTFTDQCGNSSSVSQLITVKDETAPVLLVELGLTNLSCVDQIPPYEEVLGLIGENIYDECDSGLPTVNLVEDTGEPNCIDGVFARTYSVEVCDACGNCAVYQLTYSGQCGEFCTLTQGGWGNAGGKYPWPDADGKATTTEIITALMDANGPIIIGDLAGNSLTIEDPDCVLALLPGGGPSGPLPTGTNVVNNGNNCKPADASMLNKQGRLNNNLVAQTVALQINVWYSSMAKGTNLGDLLLGGACLPINGSGLPETVQTVQDLLDYTNAYLGGAVSGGNSLSGALNTAVSGINEYFDGCKLPPVFKEQPADDPVDEEPTGEEPLTCDEFCTLTQGGWGNAGGQYTWNDADGKAYTEDIISALMDKYGDIILGNPQSMRSLTVKDPGCAITLLPAGGSAMPLPAGHAFSSKPNKCRVYGTDQQRKNGRLNNVLAGQVVALQLNIWYSSEMYGSDLGATTLGGECLPVNTEGLPPSIGTVADLLNYANLVLNNQVGSDYAGLLLTGQSDLPTQLAPVLTDAITKVNEYFDGCQPAAFVNEHLVTDRMNDPQLDITAGLKELRLTPNPAMDQVTIDFNTSEEGETRLRINDLQGREVYRAEQLSVTGNNMFRVNTDDLSSGLYIVTLLQGDALLQSKLVIVKE